MDGSSDTERADRHSRKRAVVGTVLALLLVLLVVEVVTIARNNTRFDEWKSELLDHPVPPNSILLETGSRFGLLWGNGNHCDGEAWMILRSDLSATELERHYSDVANLSLWQRVATDTWRVSTETRIDTAGLDLRCH